MSREVQAVRTWCGKGRDVGLMMFPRAEITCDGSTLYQGNGLQRNPIEKLTFPSTL